jgi:hypothetical protein
MSTKVTIILGACLIAGLLAYVVIPNFFPGRPPMQQFSCVANLRQLEGAKEQWALEFHKSTNDIVTATDLLPYYAVGGTTNHRAMLNCPQGGTYTLGRVGELPSCSISEHTAKYREHP